MPVPFLTLKAQTESIRKEIEKEFAEIIDNTGFVLGPKVKAFEENFAEFCGVDHCIAVSSGTAAVHLMLWAADMPKGSGIIVPANTFIASAEGISLAGHIPVFVDVSPGTYNISPSGLEKFLQENRSGNSYQDPRSGAEIRAILAVDLYGQAAEMKELEKITESYGLLLFEDACQAHGASIGKRKTGSFGTASAFSFYPGKNMGAWGEGGAVSTRSSGFAEKIRMLRDHGSNKKYHHSLEGHNYRMSAFQGAVLGVKLKYIKSWNDGRSAAAERYCRLLEDVAVELPERLDGYRHVFHLFAVHTPYRDELREFLAEREIGAGLHYPIPLHLQPAYEHLGYRKGDFPVAEYNAFNNLTLPMFPELNEEQQQEVTSAIKEFFKTKKL